MSTCNTQYVSHGNLYNHFKSILNSNRKVNIPPDNHEKGKLNHAFTIEELQKARRSLRNGKATGADNLTNEMIPCFTEIYPLLSIKLFNDILDSNKPIPDWTIGLQQYTKKDLKLTHQITREYPFSLALENFSRLY